MFKNAGARFGTALFCLVAASWSGCTPEGGPAGDGLLAAPGDLHQLTGTVFAAGAPMSGASVQVLDDLDVVVATDTTDAAGQFQLTLAAGTYELQVTPPAGSPFQGATIAGFVMPDADARQDVILVPPEGLEFELSGTVTGYQGVPAAGATVNVRRDARAVQHLRDRGRRRPLSRDGPRRPGQHHCHHSEHQPGVDQRLALLHPRAPTRHPGHRGRHAHPGGAGAWERAQPGGPTSGRRPSAHHRPDETSAIALHANQRGRFRRGRHRRQR